MCETNIIHQVCCIENIAELLNRQMHVLKASAQLDRKHFFKTK